MIAKEHLAYFDLLKSTTSNPQKKALIKTITDDQLKSLCEIVFNVLNENIPVKTSYKGKLLRYKNLWIDLTDRRISLKKKKAQLKAIPILTLLEAISLK